MSESPSLASWLDPLESYEGALANGLVVLEASDLSLESLTRAMEQLEAAALRTSSLRSLDDIPSLAERGRVEERLRQVRLRHGLVLQRAAERLGEVDQALQSLREFRKKVDFYGASGSEMGESCDIAC